MDSLRNRGAVRVLGGDGGPERVVITSEGMAAIRVEAEADEALTSADTRPTPADAEVQAVEAPAPSTEADGAATLPSAGPRRRRPSRARPRRPRSPRRAPACQAGADDRAAQAPRGAPRSSRSPPPPAGSITIRGAISGALKKKLGLTIEATRTREVGPNKTGAKGSSTVYRIVKADVPPSPACAPPGSRARRRLLRLFVRRCMAIIPPIAVSSPRGQFAGIAAEAIAFWTRTKPRVLF